MKTLLQNWFLLVPIILILISLFFSLKDKFRRKHIVAALHLSFLFFLVYGLVQLFTVFFPKKISDEKTQFLKSQNKEILTPTYLNTYKPIENINASSFNKAFVYLDFSGSVKPKELLDRTHQIKNAMSTIPETNFYYFGSCTGKLESISSLTEQSIKNIQDSLCSDNIKLRRNTSITKALISTLSLLETEANSSTIVIYITDDEQSPAISETETESFSTETLKQVEKFKKYGVVFQLIKLPPSLNRDHIISNDILSKGFYVENVDFNTDYSKKLQDILKARAISNDLMPLQGEGEKNQNLKLTFKYPTLPSGKGVETPVNVEINNQYKNYHIAVRIDSLVSKYWRATIKNDIDQPYYLKLKPNEITTVSLPFTIESNGSPYFLNSEQENEVKTYYTILYPGSQEYDVDKWFKRTNYGFNTLTDAPFNNLKSSIHFSPSKVKFSKSPSFWWYFVLAGIFLLLGNLFKGTLTPTLKQRKITIKNHNEDRNNPDKWIKNKKRIIYREANIDNAFIFKPKSVKYRFANILSQPKDTVLVESRYPLNAKGANKKTVIKRKTFKIENGGSFTVKVY